MRARGAGFGGCGGEVGVGVDRQSIGLESVCIAGVGECRCSRVNARSVHSRLSTRWNMVPRALCLRMEQDFRMQITRHQYFCDIHASITYQICSKLSRLSYCRHMLSSHAQHAGPIALDERARASSLHKHSPNPIDSRMSIYGGISRSYK